MEMISKNGDVITAQAFLLDEDQYYKLNSEKRFDNQVLNTDWPDEIEIVEIDHDQQTIHARLTDLDAHHDACKSLVVQGWDITAVRGATIGLEVSDQLDCDALAEGTDRIDAGEDEAKKWEILQDRIDALYALKSVVENFENVPDTAVEQINDTISDILDDHVEQRDRLDGVRDQDDYDPRTCPICNDPYEGHVNVVDHSRTASMDSITDGGPLCIDRRDGLNLYIHQASNFNEGE